MWRGPLSFWKKRPHQFRAFSSYFVVFLDIMTFFIVCEIIILSLILLRDLFDFYFGNLLYLDKSIVYNFIVSIFIFVPILILRRTIKSIEIHIDRD